NVPGGYVEVVTGTRNSHAILSVINTGPVISAAAVDGLLRPFQRLGSDRTGHGDGLRLGLSIVQAIAHAPRPTLTLPPPRRLRPHRGCGLEAEVSFPARSTASSNDSIERHLSAEPAGQAT